MLDKWRNIFGTPEILVPTRPDGKKNWNDCGDLWLRVADQRDVFYADSVEVNSPIHDFTAYKGITKPSIGYGELWFDGTKHEFFKIDVEVENTIIEGFYEDNELIGETYEVTIYLEVE